MEQPKRRAVLALEHETHLFGDVGRHGKLVELQPSTLGGNLVRYTRPKQN